MKNMNYYLLRIIVALILGLVLILWPANALVYLVITIGVLFMIAGVASIVGAVACRRGKECDFPFTAVGSILFGLLLVIKPVLFINVLMYLLGAILLLGGIEQIVMLVRARKNAVVSPFVYVIPALVIIAGIIVLTDPFAAAETAFIILGVASLIYGVFELIAWFAFDRKSKLRKVYIEE